VNEARGHVHDLARAVVQRNVATVALETRDERRQQRTQPRAAAARPRADGRVVEQPLPPVEEGSWLVAREEEAVDEVVVSRDGAPQHCAPPRVRVREECGEEGHARVAVLGLAAVGRHGIVPDASPSE
jgi:hypothetical protein